MPNANAIANTNQSGNNSLKVAGVIVGILATFAVAAVGYGMMRQKVETNAAEIEKLRTIPERLSGIEADVKSILRKVE